MRAAEIAQVTRAHRPHETAEDRIATRRYQPDRRGLRLDMRRTLRGSFGAPAATSSISIGSGGSTSRRRFVALLDISGSMSELPGVPAFPATAIHRCGASGCRCFCSAPADQCDAVLAGARSRRGAGALFGDGSGTGPAAPASPPLAAQLQQIMGPAGAGAGRDRAC